MNLTSGLTFLICALLSLSPVMAHAIAPGGAALSTEADAEKDPKQPAADADKGVKFPVVETEDLPDDDPHDVSLWIFLSDEKAEKNVPVYGSPATGKPIGVIAPGDIVQVVKQITHPGWRQVYFPEASSPEAGPQLWFRYNDDAMRFLSKRPELALKFRAPLKKTGQVVYRDPGFWDPSDCTADPSICVARLSETTHVYLSRSEFRLVSDARSRSETWMCFYEVRVEEKSDDVIGVKGWLPAKMLMPIVAEPYFGRPRIKTKPKPKPAPPPPTKEEADLFALRGNADSPEQREAMLKKAGIPKKEAEQVKSISGLTLHYNLRAGGNYLLVTQPFAGPDYQITAGKVGGGIATNLFLDLELQLSADFGLPITSSSNNAYAKGFYFDGQQWFMYTTPWQINETPIKLGLGMYYTSLVTQRAIGGLPGIVGFQGKVVFEGQRWSLGLRAAPVAQDLAVNLQNRLLGAELLYSLDWRINARNVQIKADFTDIYYNNPDSGYFTGMKVIGAAMVFPIGF